MLSLGTLNLEKHISGFIKGVIIQSNIGIMKDLSGAGHPRLEETVLNNCRVRRSMLGIVGVVGM